MKPLRIFFIIFVWIVSCNNRDSRGEAGVFFLRHDGAGSISVVRSDTDKTVLVQNAKEGIRPYIHPITPPDGRGVMTEYSPAHHPHQTGLYWGLKKVNGRDFFMNWRADHWRRISAEVVADHGARVAWRTRYQLLDDEGEAVMAETQTWSFHEQDEAYILDLEWSGTAAVDVTMQEFYVGGLFLRMPWSEGVRGEVINAAGQRNGEAEGERAIWNDIGIQIEGRQDLAHIAILDHPDNEGFPVAWRVDNELGVGPSRQILGDWAIRKGDTEVIRYRLIIYTGDLVHDEMNTAWKDFMCDEADDQVDRASGNSMQKVQSR